MLATRTAIGVDMLYPSVVSPSVVCFHEPDTATKKQLHYAPAVSFMQHVTAHHAIEALRRMPSEDYSVYYIFVTDYERHLVGVVSLWQLVSAPPGAQLCEIMDQRKITMPHDASLTEQANLMDETGLLALPVVDEEGRLVGALDYNDLIAAVKNEATEEVYNLGGVCQDEHVNYPLFDSIKKRVVQLFMLLLGLALVAWTITAFQGVVAQFVVIAALIPVVAGQGSRASMQTVSFIVHSLTLGDVRWENARRVLNRELAMSVVSGVCIGLVVWAGVLLWQGSVVLGLVAGVATLFDILIAALAGVLIPLVLKSLHINPAKFSLVLVTTVVGVCGVFFFLGLGMLVLQMGYL